MKKTLALMTTMVAASVMAQGDVDFHIVSAGVILPGDTLRYTTNDAQLISDVFGESAKTNVLLLSGSGKAPTLANIQAGVAQALKAADENDVVWFHFSGHGAPHPSNGRTMLFPQDFKAGDLNSFLDISEFRRLMRDGTKARLVVLSLDACYSGGTRSMALSNANTMLTPFSGTVVMASSLPDQTSLELPQLRHGLFTYYLARGIAGEAGNPISMGGLYEYVKAKMAAWAKSGAIPDTRPQTPVFLIPQGQGQQPPTLTPPAGGADAIPAETDNTQVTAVTPLPPSVIVVGRGTGEQAETVAKLAQSKIRQELLNGKYPVVSEDLAGDFKTSYTQSGTQAGKVAYQRFGAAFLLDINTESVVETNSAGGYTARVTIYAKILTAKGAVLAEVNSERADGKAHSAADFSASSAMRKATDSAVKQVAKLLMESLNQEVRPRLTAGMPTVGEVAEAAFPRR